MENTKERLWDLGERRRGPPSCGGGSKRGKENEIESSRLSEENESRRTWSVVSNTAYR